MEIGKKIKESGLVGLTPSGLVITGGGAKTVGIVDSAKRMLAMPVRVGIPTNLKGIIDEAEDSSFSTAIGLIRYGANTETKASFGGFSLPKIGGFKFPTNGGKFGKKLIDLIKSFIP